MNARSPAWVFAPAVPAGVVTAIDSVPRHVGRWSVTVDGVPCGTVSIDLIERLGLTVGRALDDASAAALTDGVRELAVYDRALGMLAASARSARDLRLRLVRKGAPPELTDAAVERLRTAGLVDDAAYARQVARSRVAGRGDSRRRVGQALARAGVARELATDAVAEVFAEEGVDERALALEAARKRLRSLTSVDAPTRTRRLYGFLARRGYDAGTIQEVLRKVHGDESEGDM